MDVHLGSTYSTDLEALEEGAAQEVEPTVEDTTAILVTKPSSAQQPEQSRYPQRERKQATKIYRAYAAKATEHVEPQTCAEAMQASDAAQWKLAMDKYLTSLQENGTWTLEH